MKVLTFKWCFCLTFSPSGWDNEKKIGILHENFQTLKADDNFEDVIVKPPVRKVRTPFIFQTFLYRNYFNVQALMSGIAFQFVHEKEVQAEDDQVFLVKLQVMLQCFVCVQYYEQFPTFRVI